MAISIVLISSSWSGSGLLTTTVSEASVSGDSVGEITGDVLTVSSTVGCCSCLGCVGFFAPSGLGHVRIARRYPGHPPLALWWTVVAVVLVAPRPTSEH